MYSSGESWNCLYVVDDSDIYSIMFSSNLIMHWGDILVTTMSKDDIDLVNIVPRTKAEERHMYPQKLVVSAKASPPYFTKCNGNTDTSVISCDLCFTYSQWCAGGRHCYTSDGLGGFFGQVCWVGDPSLYDKGRVWQGRGYSKHTLSHALVYREHSENSRDKEIV